MLGPNKFIAAAAPPQIAPVLEAVNLDNARSAIPFLAGSH
jgi:hypothetical protein